MVPQEERTILWEVIVYVILSKKVYTYIHVYVLFLRVSEIELFHCTVRSIVYRRATSHVLTEDPKCIDVEGELLEKVLH
jgi:hypothetical protein